MPQPAAPDEIIRSRVSDKLNDAAQLLKLWPTLEGTAARKDVWQRVTDIVFECRLLLVEDQ